MATNGEDLEKEIQLLEAIYTTELSHISRYDNGGAKTVNLQLHPATGDDHHKKFVCLELQFSLSLEYPRALPEFTIKNPRGLSEEHITKLNKQILQTAKEKEGECMLYDLIELVKESLTQSNVPHGDCAICLDRFHEASIFTKTDCYHYFHCYCLLRYVRHEEEQLRKEAVENARDKKHQHTDDKPVVCPMCRSPLHISAAELSVKSPSVCEEPFRFVPDEALSRMQRDMAERLHIQKENGGLINLEEEKNKYLLPARVLTSANDTKRDTQANKNTNDTTVATAMLPESDKQSDSQPDNKPPDPKSSGTGRGFNRWRGEGRYDRRNDWRRTQRGEYYDRNDKSTKSAFVHTRHDRREREKIENRFSTNDVAREKTQNQSGVNVGNESNNVQNRETVSDSCDKVVTKGPQHSSRNSDAILTETNVSEPTSANSKSEESVQKETKPNHSRKYVPKDCGHVHSRNSHGFHLSTEDISEVDMKVRNTHRYKVEPDSGSPQSDELRQERRKDERDVVRNNRGDLRSTRVNHEKTVPPESGISKRESRKDRHCDQMTYSEKIWNEKHQNDLIAESGKHKFTFKRSNQKSKDVNNTGNMLDKTVPDSQNSEFTQFDQVTNYDKTSTRGRGRGRGRHNIGDKWNGNVQPGQSNSDRDRPKGPRFSYKKDWNKSPDLVQCKEMSKQATCDSRGTMHDNSKIDIQMQKQHEGKQASDKSTLNLDAVSSLQGIAGVLSGNGEDTPVFVTSHSKGACHTGEAPPGFATSGPPPGFALRPAGKVLNTPPGFA